MLTITYMIVPDEALVRELAENKYMIVPTVIVL